MPNNYKHPREREAGIGLSLIVALSSAAAIALVMIGCAAIELRQDPSLTIKQLFIEHLAYVLLLGGVIHLATWLALKFLLSRRLDQIYVHLYGIGEGKLQPLKIESNIREIKLIVGGINLMIWRIGRSQDAGAFAQAEKDLLHLKETVGQIAADNPEMLADLSESVDSLERSFLAFTQDSHPSLN